MGSSARAVMTGLGILLLMVGIPMLVMGLILRETGLFGLVFIVGGGYLSFEGVTRVVEAWIAGRRAR